MLIFFRRRLSIALSSRTALSARHFIRLCNGQASITAFNSKRKQ